MTEALPERSVVPAAASELEIDELIIRIIADLEEHDHEERIAKPWRSSGGRKPVQKVQAVGPSMATAPRPGSSAI